jgi:hypothetical protein
VIVSFVLWGAAGCADGGGDTTTTAAPTEATTTAPTTTGETTTAPEPQPFPQVTPGRVLARFVRAAAAGNPQEMWRLLSVPSQRRLGPTFTAFQNRVAPRLQRQVGVFVPGRSRVFLEEPITALFAVAAYGGRTTVGEGQPFGTYAVALRREDPGWRLELGGPVELEPLGPDPGERASGTFQVAAGIEANAGIVEAGLWLDGQAVPGRTSGVNAQRVTIFSESRGRIPRGPHAVVAFASTFADASALGWMFTYRGKSGGG